MFCKILLCVNDSPLSDQIAHVAADLARRYKAEVVVLSVLDPSRFACTPYSGLEAISMVDRHSRTLADTGQRIRAAFEGMGIVNRLLVLPGRTAETVLEVAHQEGVDLIVMGGETKSRLRAAMEGSLWADIARTAPCNVLRVSPKEEEAPVERPNRRPGMRIPLGLRRHAVDPLAC
jgi:nucleotide-binding universal stress UspA family protein